MIFCRRLKRKKKNLGEKEPNLKIYFSKKKVRFFIQAFNVELLFEYSLLWNINLHIVYTGRVLDKGFWF